MPRKSKTTVNVDLVKKEAKKLAKDTVANMPANQGYKELSPGSVSRQSPLEQDMGSSRYRQMIHDHNKKNEHILDKLPFTFPKKRIVRTQQNQAILCPKCEETCFIGDFTLLVICGRCQNVFEVNKGNFKPNVGMFNRASDLLKEDKS